MYSYFRLSYIIVYVFQRTWDTYILLLFKRWGVVHMVTVEMRRLRDFLTVPFFEINRFFLKETILIEKQE